MTLIPDDLVAFKLTAVFYGREDVFFGHFMAAASLMPMCVARGAACRCAAL